MLKKIGVVLLLITMTLGIKSVCILAKTTDKQIVLEESRKNDKKVIKEIIDLLKKVKSLEEVNEEDRQRISQYFEIDFEVAVEIGKKGYPIFDSLNISRIIQNYGFNIQDIEKLLQNNKEVEVLERELLKLEQISESEKIPGDYANEFKKLYVDGYSVEEIYSAFRIAKPFSVKIDDVIKKSNKEENSKKLTKILSGYNNLEAKIIENLSENYFIDIEEVIKISEKQKLSISDIKSKIIDNENERNFLNGIDVKSITTNTSDGTQNIDYSKYIYAPFTYERDKSESICLSNGSLTYNNIDYVLPGRNGLDLEISSRYDSSNSGLYKESSGMSFCKDGGDILYKYVAFGIKEAYYYRADLGKFAINRESYYLMRSTVESYAQQAINTFDREHPDISEFQEDGIYYKEDYYGYIEVYSYLIYEGNVNEDNYIITSGVEPNIYEKTRHRLGAGWSFGFSSLEINGSPMYLHLGNGQVQEITGDPTGEMEFIFSDYKIKDMRLERDETYFDGKRESKYVLIYKDGKKEYFSWDGSLIAIKDRYNNTIKFHYTSTDDPKISFLSGITDTLGRKVNFSYINTYPGKEVIVTLPNNQTIRYVLETIPGHHEYMLKKKIDQKNRETIFNYDIQETYFSVDSKVLVGAKNYHALLKEITYPSKAKSIYSYEKIKVNMGKDGSTESYRLISRKDIDKNTENNNEVYTYDGNYSGYPIYTDPKLLPNTFTYETIVTNGSNSTTYKFNNKHLLINKQIRDHSLNLLKEISYEYDSNKLPTKETETSYGQDISTSQKETSSIYNEYGDRIKYVNELGGETYYEYDPVFHIPCLIYEMSDGEIKNKIEYSIDSVSGNINWMKKHHFENGIDKSIFTEYRYDIYGNLINEKLIQKDDRIIEKSYEYSSEYKNGYLTKTLMNVTDYENNSKVISEMYTYDFNTGNKISFTDGNGKRYVYEFDALDRLIKETNPDLTYKTIDFDDLNNITVLTNEKPFSIRQQYDGLGRFIKKEEQKDSGWTILEERHYNNLGEMDWTKDADGNLTTYQYDVLGRIIKTIFPDGAFAQTEYIDSENMKIEFNEEGHGSYFIYDNAGNLRETWNERIDENNIPRQHKVINEYDKFGKIRFVNDLGSNSITEYRYDDLGRLVQVINSLNESTLYEYDNLDKIIKQTTAGGSITEKYYNELGRLTQEKDPLQKSEYTAYDANGDIIKKKDRNGTVFGYIYDDLNRLRIVTNETAASIIYDYEYDATGNMTSAKNAQGTTYYEYYDNGQLKRETSPDNKFIYFEYNNNGSKSKMVDHFGKETLYSYDLRGRLETVTIDGETTTYGYNLDGSRAYILYPSGIKEEYYYDEINNLIRLVNKKADGIIINEFIYTYDDAGNQKTKLDKNGLTEYTYDALNRVKSVLNSDGTKIKYLYDRNGNIDCEVFGRIDSGIENDYAVKDYVYDPALYRLSHVVQESVGLYNLKISPDIAYLSADEQVTFTLSGTMNNGNIASDILLSNAVWTCDSDALTLNITNGKSAVGVIEKSSWDAMSITDVITVWVSLEGKTVEARVYKNGVKSLTITPTIVYAHADQEMTFTLTGRMNDGTDITSELLSSAIWTTDSDILTLNTSQGVNTTCYIPKASWDLMGYEEITKIRVTLGGLYSEADIKKFAVGRLTIIPSDVALLQLRTSTLILSGEMNDGTVIPDEILNTATWTCNPLGLPLSSTTGKTIVIGSMRNRVPSGIYIVSASVQGKSAQVTVRHSVVTSSVDSHNNLNMITLEIIDLEKSVLNGESEDTKIENIEDGELLNSTEESTEETNDTNSELDIPFESYTVYFQYDNNGNLIEKKVVKVAGEEITGYGYNELNQLTQLANSSGVTTYTYNSSGLRETKTNGGETTKYYYDGQNVIIETINDSFSARNIFGINPIARETKDSKLYYLYNGHADVVAMVDSNGNVINSYNYDIYGNIKEANEVGIENPIRYAGQYYDNESDLYYLRARYYDPELMRFITEDTNRGDVKDPLSLNLYVYCQGNPVRYFDPSGNVPVETIFDIVSIGTSVVDLIRNPSWANAGFLLWDVGSAIIPYVPGSYVVKGLKIASKADDAIDTAKAISKIDDAADIIKTVDNAITAPTNRNGLKTAMLKLGDKPFDGAQAHHGLPWNFKDWFSTRGINVNDTKYGAWVKGGGNGGHQSWSKAYDNAWRKFIDNNPNATAEQIEKFYDILRRNKIWGGGF